MKRSLIIKECRLLARASNIVFKRSKTIDKINGKACYEIESGIECKTLAQGSLIQIWEDLASQYYANK